MNFAYAPNIWRSSLVRKVLAHIICTVLHIRRSCMADTKSGLHNGALRSKNFIELFFIEASFCISESGKLIKNQRLLKNFKTVNWKVESFRVPEYSIAVCPMDIVHILTCTSIEVSYSLPHWVVENSPPNINVFCVENVCWYRRCCRKKPVKLWRVQLIDLLPNFRNSRLWVMAVKGMLFKLWNSKHNRKFTIERA